MDRSDSQDAPVEWWASDEDSHGGRAFWVSMLVVGLPVVVLFFAGAAGTAFGSALMSGLLLVGVVVGAIDWWRDRHAVVSIVLDGPQEFVVRQVDGGVARYPLASVSRVRATRDDGDDTVWMRISVGDRVVRTRPGRAEVASRFLAVCTESGADVIWRTAVSD